MKTQSAVYWLVMLLSCPAAAASGEWTCRPGIKTPVRLRDGNVECASQNGRDCLWGACSGADVVTSFTPPSLMDPLICGADHMRKYGTDGYSQADHWCRHACDALGCGITVKQTQVAAPRPSDPRSSDRDTRKEGAADDNRTADPEKYETPPTRLAGPWIAVDDAARAGAVKIQGCFPVYDAYNFVVDHGRVTVMLEESRWGAMPPPHMLMLGGGWRGGTLRLDGREEGGMVAPQELIQHWILRWDSAKEQLVGQRNGTSIRLSRLIVASPPPQQCGSPPP